MKFKVGDTVRVIYDDKGFSGHIGYCGKVTRVHKGDFYPYAIQNKSVKFSDEELELVTKEDKSVSVIDKLRELRMDKDDRVLYKHGLIHETGKLTEEGKCAVIEQAFDYCRDDLVLALKELDKEEKANKK